MRIAVVETSRYGGMLHYAFQLSEALADLGSEVDLVVPRAHELHGVVPTARLHGNPRLRVRELLVPQVDAARTEPRNRLAYQLRRMMVAQRLLRSAIRALRLVRSRARYDAVLLQWELPFPVLTQVTELLLRAPRRPAVGYVLHNVVPFNRGSGVELTAASDRERRTLSALLPRFDAIFVHGERSLVEYRETWPPAEVTVIPHGHQELFGTAVPEPSVEERVLFFGDWRKVKGLPVLMDAFDDVVRRRPSARLTIAGAPAPSDFDDRGLRAWAARHRDAVTLVPHYVPMDEVSTLFAQARVVVLPYLAASQSGVLHLAMTFGRAVVVSEVGSLPEVVEDQVTGLVVPPGDAGALADALTAVLADAARAARMGAAGRERLTAHADWATTAALVERAVRHRVGGHDAAG